MMGLGLGLPHHHTLSWQCWVTTLLGLRGGYPLPFSAPCLILSPKLLSTRNAEGTCESAGPSRGAPVMTSA